MKSVRHASGESGQIALALAFAVLGIAFLLLLVFDVFLAARGKMRLQNAGDAAALAAAAWQGRTLNLIGDLNIVRIAAACAGETNAIDGIVALQERLAFAGPIMGFLSANLAAKANGAPHQPGIAALVGDEAAAAQAWLSPTETWPDKPSDYAQMVGAVLASCEGELCVGCDNASFYTGSPAGGHILYNRGFYAAAESGNWIWFCRFFGWDHSRATQELMGFSGNWGDPPPLQPQSPLNPEYFGVHLRVGYVNFTNDVNRAAGDTLLAAAAEYGVSLSTDALEASGLLGDSRLPWFFLDTSFWRPWVEVDPDGPDRFPLLGRVKESFDLLGAGAACRTERLMTPVSETMYTNTFVWTAAAKPFGSLDFAPGPRVTDLFAVWDGQPFPRDAPLVMPAFSFSRLIPLGGIGEANLYRADVDWVEHCRDHVPSGMGRMGCRFCEIAAMFAQRAVEGAKWLMEHDHDQVCQPPGDGPHGGTRHGH